MGHVATSASHRCHAYVYPVGFPDQEPLFAVSVWPTLGVPVIVGGAVLLGAIATRSAIYLYIKDSRFHEPANPKRGIGTEPERVPHTISRRNVRLRSTR